MEWSLFRFVVIVKQRWQPRFIQSHLQLKASARWTWDVPKTVSYLWPISSFQIKHQAERLRSQNMHISERLRGVRWRWIKWVYPHVCICGTWVISKPFLRQRDYEAFIDWWIKRLHAHVHMARMKIVLTICIVFFEIQWRKLLISLTPLTFYQAVVMDCFRFNVCK